MSSTPRATGHISTPSSPRYSTFKLETFEAMAHSTTSLTMRTTTFSKFTKLPLELQLKIWNHAYADLGPQIVRLSTVTAERNQDPALLHVCRTTRNEFLRKFTILTGLTVFTKKDHLDVLAYIRFDIDFVSLRDGRSWYNGTITNDPLTWAVQMYSKIFLLVKNLAIQWKTFNSAEFVRYTGRLANTHELIWDRLATTCPALEQIVFTLNSDMVYYTSMNNWSPSPRTSGETAVAAFQDILARGIGKEKDAGRWKKLAVYTARHLDGPWSSTEKDWVCFSE